MKKEVTFVPKDKCPLDVLAEMEERTAIAWIYFHENAVKKLEKSCDSYEELAHCIKLTWNATEEFPATAITIGTEVIGCWKPVYSIDAEDIAFKSHISDPEEILFLQMEE